MGLIRSLYSREDEGWTHGEFGSGRAGFTTTLVSVPTPKKGDPPPPSDLEALLEMFPRATLLARQSLTTRSGQRAKVEAALGEDPAFVDEDRASDWVATGFQFHQFELDPVIHDDGRKIELNFAVENFYATGDDKGLVPAGVFGFLRSGFGTQFRV